jgi:hypothetical protein
MAGNEERKVELAVELARARGQLNQAKSGMRRSLDMRARVRQGVARHTVTWIVAAVVIGVVIARLPRRTKKVYVQSKGGKETAETAGKAGLGLLVLKFMLDVFKPTLLRMASQRLEPYATRFTQGRSRSKERAAV